MSELLQRSRPADGVLLLVINRPDLLNPVSMKLQREIDSEVAAAAKDPRTRCIVLAGAGGKALSSGYDIHELAEMSEGKHTLVQVEREELLWRWLTSPKPTVTACTGITFGAGMLYATSSDLRIGSPSTRIKVTATMYGGANLTWLLDHIIGVTASRDMLLTSREVRGEEAASIGFFSRYTDDDQVLDTAIEAATQIAANDPTAVTEVKRLLVSGLGREVRARYDDENTVMLTSLRPEPVTEMFKGFLQNRDRPRSKR
jgi:2-(1,2-epoxy-1,2-dihydrophenyl)acetyl-CoA isomerase